MSTQRKEKKKVSFFTTTDPQQDKKKKKRNISEKPKRVIHPHKRKPLLEYIDRDDNPIIIPYIEEIVQKPKNTKINEKIKIKEKFNKLYGIDSSFKKNYRLIKKDKELSLSDHQNKLLNISTNLSKDHVLRLYTAFKYLKADSETIKPLPPINFDIIYKHSLKEAEKGRYKDRTSLKNQLFKKDKMDEFELEMLNITKSKFNRVKKDDPTTYKIYENLPEHIVEAILKNKALH